MVDDLISKLSEIRSDYNCFDEDGEPYYRALSEAIRILSQRADGDTISRKAALDAITDELMPSTPLSVVIRAKNRLKDLPAAQPDHNADISKKAEGDCISRQAAIDALARMMPRSYTPDGSHPADEEIFRAQEIFADCIEALEILTPAQPATNCSEIPNGSDDTISRQAAIDVLDEQIEQCNKALCSFYISPKDEYAIKVERASLEAYKEQLENMPSAQPEQKTDEWIPISKETNPTKSGWYLVTVHGDATNENKRFTGVAEFNAINGMWYDIDEPTDVYLRWMPLPAPHRGGEQDDR